MITSWLFGTLALFALTDIWIFGEGPGGLLTRLRYQWQRRMPAALHDLATCPMCAGFWIALPISGWAWTLSVTAISWLPLLWLATYGGHLILLYLVTKTQTP